MNVQELAIVEWQQFKSSKVLKAVIAAEVGAVSLFVQGFLSGTQALTFDALKGWLLAQIFFVFVLLIRHTLAGIESKLDALGVPKEIAESAELGILKAVEAKHPDIVAAIRNKPAES